MADNSHTTPGAAGDVSDHQATYAGFLIGSVALTLICLYLLVALVAFRFVSHPLNLLMGFGGLILGVIAILIDMRASGRWYVSGGLLAVFGLLTAIAIS